MQLKQLRPIALGLSASLLILLFSTALAGTTHCVRADGGGSCFSSIQAAVDFANEGDRINIARGTYFENVIVDKELTLRGGSATNTIIDADAPNTGTGIEVTADNVTIEKLAVYNGKGDGIEVNANNVFIQNTIVKGAEQYCLEVNGDDGHVKRSSFIGCDFGNIEVIGDDIFFEQNQVKQAGGYCVIIQGRNPVVTRNHISVCDDAGVELTDTDNPIVNNNTFVHTENDAINVYCDDGNGACSGGEIRSNKMTDTGLSGSDCLEVTADVPDGDFVIADNHCHRSYDSAFNIRGAGLQLINNRVFGGGEDSGDEAFNIQGEDHYLERNRVEDWHSIAFELHGSGHTLSRNDARRSLADGFRILGDDITLANNVAQDNLGEGFEVTDGATNTELVDNRGQDNRTDFCDDGIGTITDGNRFGTIGTCEVADDASSLDDQGSGEGDDGEGGD